MKKLMIKVLNKEYSIEVFKNRVREKGLADTLKVCLLLLITLCYRWLTNPGGFILLYYEYFMFLASSPFQYRKRLYIIKRFRTIHRVVPCLHPEGELLRVADAILRVPCSLEGDIIECGTYKGGSTCKLSVIAKLTGRLLIACDSFQGLPCREAIVGNGENKSYNGKFTGTIDEVRYNIETHGEIDSVELISGWYSETLPQLRGRKFVAIFEDADLYDSILCCIENLWDSLAPSCKFYTHEGHKVHIDPEAKAFEDSGLPPLILVGRGRRLTTPHLGYIVKPNPNQ